MEGAWNIAFMLFQVWLTIVAGLIVLPAMFGVSLGFTDIYIKVLVKTLEWATLRIQRGQKEQPTLPPQTANGIIEKDDGSMEEEIGELRRSHPKNLVGGDFTLCDAFYFCKKGIENIVEDQVTQRFTSEELASWNLLTRTNNNFSYISVRLTIIWGLGVFIRYCILLPLRENRPKKGGICVANHTSPIDIVILANDGCYAMVGQVHGGLMGVIQRSMVRSCPHVWFERSEMKDRHAVAKRLKDHIADKTKLPILIFPEGTCINNTSVMMFKKGSFEIGGTIYPVAIKYDPQFGDAFWNSAKYNMVSYLLRMMTSWAIVCNVWYLPPMTRQDGEDAVHFANRVKSAIADQGGLVDLSWDGGLKREKVKESLKEEQQKMYSSMIVGSDFHEASVGPT
ncbi:glycerol-3-phosphate acyltransferase 3 isoform X3 [Garra rufa]|uniref:glycerol-3-phosphate acyltransferase 3 isoform X3 n=1 Tax=Garra rufa TaxID=137080 RepID=UPI003CCEA7E2